MGYMFTIRNYTNTKCELELAKTRLNFLIEKKEKLYSKYFSLSPKLKDVIVDGREESKDKMADYMHELHEIDLGVGMSLADEIDYQQKRVKNIQSYIDHMNNTLSKMTGLEYQLYYEIVFNGGRISHAVNNIAELNNLDTSTIWRVYKKIKKDVKKVIKFSKCQ